MRDLSSLSDEQLDNMIAQYSGSSDSSSNTSSFSFPTLSMPSVSGVANSVGAFTKGVGHGLYEAAQGPYQLGLEAVNKLGLDEYNQADMYKRVVDAQRKAYNDSLNPDNKLASQIGNFTGNVLPYIATPGSPLVAGALQGATSYVPEGDSRLLNTAIGAAVGKGTEFLGKGIGKVYNAIKGGTEDAAAQAIIQSGQKHNVPVFASDAAGNGFIKKVTEGLEDVPILGVRAERKGQMQAASDAAAQVIDDLKQKMINASPNLGGIQKIADSGDSIRRKTAQSILSDVQNAGDDWNKIIQNSGNLKLYNAKLEADNKYNKLEELANQYGNVGKDNTLAALDNSISGASESVLPDKTLINQLQILKNNIASKDLNYSQMRQARSQVGNLITDYYKGANAAVGSEGAGYLQNVKNAISSDMDNFAKNGAPELKQAWQDADSFYKKNVVPYKDTQLAKALTGDSPDEIYNKFITRGTVEGDKGTSRALKFYNALDNQGQAAVRYGMVKDAFEKAIDRDTNTFSPAKFSTQLDNIAAARGVFFQGKDKQEIEGFKNLMRNVQRSKIASEKPETGIKVIPHIATGGAVAIASHFGLPVAGAAIAGIYGLKKLLTTNIGRRVLLASSKLGVNSSPATQKLIDTAGNLIRTSATKEGIDLTGGDNHTPPPNTSNLSSLSDEELNNAIDRQYTINSVPSQRQTPVTPPEQPAANVPQTPNLPEPPVVPTPSVSASDSSLQQTAPQPKRIITPTLLSKIAHIESNNNPNARSNTSSASGAFQFTNGTWKEAVKKYGTETGISLKDKNNPRAQAIMTAKMLADSAKVLRNTLGRDPNYTELYMTHFLGLGGANKMLNSHPMAYAARVFPEAARANRSLFYKNGKPVTVAQLYDTLNKKVQSA